MQKKNGVLVAGEYTLGEKIGNGSFGQIHSGKSIKTGKEVAIKLVIPAITFRSLKASRLPTFYMKLKFSKICKEEVKTV